MALSRVKRNELYKAMEAAGLGMTELTLKPAESYGAEDRGLEYEYDSYTIIRVPSRSRFTLDDLSARPVDLRPREGAGSPLIYRITALVPDSEHVRWRTERPNWEDAREDAANWARTVRRVAAAPDLWAELDWAREHVTLMAAQYENALFTSAEQELISIRLRQIADSLAISESYSAEIRGGSPVPRTGNRIFIVHAEYDQDLAQKLKDLLISWGFDAFFGRQELRQLMGSDVYRQEISEFLRKADLVMLILSSAFRHSLHCQAEAGAAAMVENIRQIPILVEPVTYLNFTQVSPMIDPRRLIDGRANFTGKLRDILRDELTDIGMPETRDRAKADECQDTAETPDACAADIERFLAAIR